MIPLCPCKQCRPKGQSLKAAMRACEIDAAIARYGHDGYERRKAAERDRLEQLRKERGGK
jgi:hypothetical protein